MAVLNTRYSIPIHDFGVQEARGSEPCGLFAFKSTGTSSTDTASPIYTFRSLKPNITAIPSPGPLTSLCHHLLSTHGPLVCSTSTDRVSLRPSAISRNNALLPLLANLSKTGLSSIRHLRFSVLMPALDPGA